MAVVDQLNLNVGTEQNPNFVLHDINDKRISTTAVTTATHILTCNSGVSSIAPISAANLAAVLGAFEHATVRENTTSFDDLPEGSIRLMGLHNGGRPNGTDGELVVCITFFRPISGSLGGTLQIAYKWLSSTSTMTIFTRQKKADGTYCPWMTFSLT